MRGRLRAIEQQPKPKPARYHHRSAAFSSMLQRSVDGLFALASLVRMLFTHEQSMCRFAVARPVYRALRTQNILYTLDSPDAWL